MTTLNDATMIAACKKGDADAVTNLLSNDPECYGRTIGWTDKELQDIETPPIFIAVDYGQMGVVDSMLNTVGADVNICDENDYTPLQWASWNGQEELVKLLIAKGACVDQDALDLAREYGHKHIQTILRQYIDFYTGLNDIDEIMIKASREGDVEKVKELIREGYDFDKWKEADGSYQEYSPIYVAMKNGHVEVIREFMQAGVEAELHSTHFHHPEGDDQLAKSAELSEEQLAAIAETMTEEEKEKTENS